MDEQTPGQMVAQEEPVEQEPEAQKPELADNPDEGTKPENEAKKDKPKRKRHRRRKNKASYKAGWEKRRANAAAKAKAEAVPDMPAQPEPLTVQAVPEPMPGTGNIEEPLDSLPHI